ncbi:MAG: HGGxSTG domain-containing protein [Bradyrhizobium sp.]
MSVGGWKHERHSLTRCGARTRSGATCKSAPVTRRRRCRMHGGAAGSGAPSGERNGNFRHGRYTKEVAATRRWIREAIELLRKNR